MSLEISLSTLERHLQRFYNQFLLDRCEVLRRTVVDISNLENDNLFIPNGLEFPLTLKLNQKILLGALQWYMPKELGALTNLWLEENWGGEFLEIKAVLLTSKTSALGYLLVSDRWSTRDFFGNILTERTVKYFSFNKVRIKRRPDPRRVKRLVRRRGYNDKGHLTLPHQSHKYDYKKLKTVVQCLEEEDLLRQKVEQLLQKIEFRITEEQSSQYLEELDFD